MSFNAEKIALEIYNKLSKDKNKLNEILSYLGYDVTYEFNTNSKDAKKVAIWLFLNNDMDQKQVNLWVNKALKKLGSNAKESEIKNYVSLYLKESYLLEANETEETITDAQLRKILLTISHNSFKTGAVKVAAKNELSQNDNEEKTNRSSQNSTSNTSTTDKSEEIFSLLKNMGVDEEEVRYLRNNIKRTHNVERWLKNHKNPELNAILAAVGAAYLRNK